MNSGNGFRLRVRERNFFGLLTPDVLYSKAKIRVSSKFLINGAYAIGNDRTKKMGMLLAFPLFRLHGLNV